MILVSSLSQLVNKVSSLEVNNNIKFYYRGEKKDYKETALFPNLYRKDYVLREDEIYREMQRFNDKEFTSDKTTFDRLSRIQHYGAPTRLLDISEDLMSAVYFAIFDKDTTSNKAKSEKKDACIYIFEIEKEKIKYYDSDAVSVVSNLAKIPFENNNEKSKNTLLCSVKRKYSIKKFNKEKSVKFLLHEIKEEKPQFEPLIQSKHLTSVICVKAKLTNDRIKSQKGLFLLFGLNPKDAKKPIQIFKDNKVVSSNKLINHPIVKIHKVTLEFSGIEKMKKDLEKIGISTPFIYPDMGIVAKDLL